MSRRAPRGIALKHTDGQPLTRQDIQYELLAAIFADENKAFTEPLSGEKMSFRDVYVCGILFQLILVLTRSQVSAIRNSPKASPALKNKMAQSQDYATDFGMLALLTNVGRLSATMGCTRSTLYPSTHDTNATASLPRDEDRGADLPPSPLAPAHGGQQYAGHAAHQDDHPGRAS